MKIYLSTLMLIFTVLSVIIALGFYVANPDDPYWTHSGTSKIADMQFEAIGRDTDGLVVYDKRTGVEYYKAPNCMTVLVDKGGKPMIYNEE